MVDPVRGMKHASHWQVLGKGAFGVVYEATCLDDNRQYACKSISKAKLVTRVSHASRSQRYGACRRLQTPANVRLCVTETQSMCCSAGRC